MTDTVNWRRRLREFVLDDSHPGRREYSFFRLAEIAHAPSTELLSHELATLTINGLITPVYRIRSSSTGVGIGDFSSLSEVPLEIFDDSKGVRQRVDLQRDIELLYRMKR